MIHREPTIDVVEVRPQTRISIAQALPCSDLTQFEYVRLIQSGSSRLDHCTQPSAFKTRRLRCELHSQNVRNLLFQ